MDRNYWNDVYANHNPWDNQYPANFIYDLVDEVKGPDKRIVDIGCGIGRNVFPFAKNAIHIDCIDISSRALESAQIHSGLYDAVFKFIHTDICNYSLEKNCYDLIIFYGVINSISKDKWGELTNKLSGSLKEGGYLALSVFTTQRIAFEDDGGLVAYAAPAEISDLFADMKIVKCDSRILPHDHYPRGKHTHSFERYIFKKEPYQRKNKSPIKIAPIGPTNPFFVSNSLRTDVSVYQNAAKKLGEFMAAHNCEYVGVPDKGLAKTALEAFLQKKPNGIATFFAPSENIELSDHNSSLESVFRERYKQSTINIISDISWVEQVAEISKLADVLVVLGHSCGCLIEIGWTKWTKKPVFASQDLAERLPYEVIDRIQYFDNTTFDDLLVSLQRHMERTIGR